MAKNMKMTRNGNVVIPMQVEAGTEAGEVIHIGNGLLGYVLTLPYAEYDEASHITYPQGHGVINAGVNHASVELLGVNLVVQLDVDGTPSFNDIVYIVDANTYTLTPVPGAVAIGWSLHNADGSDDLIYVALRASVPGDIVPQPEADDDDASADDDADASDDDDADAGDDDDDS